MKQNAIHGTYVRSHRDTRSQPCGRIHRHGRLGNLNSHDRGNVWKALELLKGSGRLLQDLAKALYTRIRLSIS